MLVDYPIDWQGKPQKSITEMPAHVLSYVAQHNLPRALQTQMLLLLQFRGRRGRQAEIWGPIFKLELLYSLRLKQACKFYP